MDPDGIPSDVILGVAVAICVIAALELATLSAFGGFAGAALAVFSIPMMIVALDRRAVHERERGERSQRFGWYEPAG